MRFDYKAVGPTGRRVCGCIEASNLVDLEMRLKRLDLDLITGHPVAPRIFHGQGHIPRHELINFCFQLEQLIRSGVPMLDGLSDLRDSFGPPHFRTVIASLIENIEGGQTLSQAMGTHPEVFSQVFMHLIQAGEDSGELPQILNNLSESLKWEDELASHTQKLLLYPSFVASIVLATTVFLMIYMVPQLKLFVKNMGQVLPIQTQILFFISDLLVDYWLIALLTTPLFVIVGQLILRSKPGARLYFDRIKLQLPVLGPILKKIILSRFASTFAMLYSAGIPVLESIRCTQKIVGNSAIRQALEDVENGINKGQNVAAAFDETKLFPPLILRMLRVGENTGGLDKALLNVSYFYTRDVKESVGKAQSLIEPLLTLFMGILLGWIMLSVIGPIYDIISKLKT